MIRRSIFSFTDEQFRVQIGDFLDSEIAPCYESWMRAGCVPREAWIKAGQAGLLCRTAPRAYGGHSAPFLQSVVIAEELGKRRFSGLLTFLQSDIVAPYFLQLATEEQKLAYLPRLCSGERIGAIAMTEPQSGSEVAQMRTTISKVDGGFILNGHKTHISNGFTADAVIVAGRDCSAPGGDNTRLTLLIVDTDMQGIKRAPISKSGMQALDTCELIFENCKIPDGKLLGIEGKGLFYLFTFLGLERLMLSIYAQASAVTILQELIHFCQTRKTSTGTLLDYQTTYTKLADLYSECCVNQAFIDTCITEQMRGRHDPRSASIAKLRATEALRSIALLGVQLRGASGISGKSGERATQDLVESCVQSIWGGASEVLRDAVGKSLINCI
ncbi:Acyl-CoA dehydrogenase, middle domain [Rhizobium mongolense subsp. loessense]|uniref:Acyl-CoA dehydrogenase, middle domain n=1 Tax=Rhizobium mongolense subsp. loessense TaxID=158890 RepID=A0A1G4UAX6_9HYPH|nr:acyl-CoA dehydrogenase family protein [Rhizobium mongolense]SCW90751.1 Acyl-CoA dehydrogenase, middle domain [Rhizobium mongolense subsp. loessense]